MDKVKELTIDSTLWATPSKLVNLLDFKPDKISVKTGSNTKKDIKVHHLKYEGGGFYLIIDNLEGYFDFSSNVGSLNMSVERRSWRINGGHGELKSSKA